MDNVKARKPGCVVNFPLSIVNSMRLFSVAAGALLSAAVHAQAYPTKAVRLIVPYPPGGSVDFTGRELAAKLSELWGQQVVLDNRGGAGSTLGHSLGAKSIPDGYTLLLGTSAGLVVSPALGTKLNYDSLKD